MKKYKESRVRIIRIIRKKDLTMIENEDTAEDNHLDLLDQGEMK